MFKSGFATIIGKPNVGKSTLINLLIGEKLAITSYKPQATRKTVFGILNSDEYQIIFIDTPGIHISNKRLDSVMGSYIDKALDDFDVAIVLTDNQGIIDEQLEFYLNKIKEKNKKAILIINKIDLMTKEKIKEIKELFASKLDFKDIIETSLTNSKDARKTIITSVLNCLNEGPKYYEDDIISTETERFIVSEIIREKIMNSIAKEIPYHIAVVVDEMKYRKEKDLHYIKANIIVERRSHKMIVIGERGKMIKEIGRLARMDLENFLKTKVFLDLWVKIREGWTKKEMLIKEYINPKY